MSNNTLFFVSRPSHRFPIVVQLFADPMLTQEGRMKHRLTPAFVEAPPAPPEGKDRIIYWEGNFGLMVTSKGHKSFVVQYRAGRQSRRMSLKAGLNLQEARREAKAILGVVARGGDPLADERKVAAALSTTLKA